MTFSSEEARLLARLETAEQTILALRHELQGSRAAELARFGELQVMAEKYADLQRRHEIRKREGAKAEQALARVFFAVTERESMPAGFDGAAAETLAAVDRLRLRLTVKRALRLIDKLDGRNCYMTPRSLGNTPGRGRIYDARCARVENRLERVERVIAAARAELAARRTG